ncbi:MAG: Crp/Fnr family transcriptional regulator [Lachnospiraceae bacterium]|nr:Crp/Fnr family transcriptional regulator [Lachnospiraceae bacterium]MBO7600380.1 Crp/Fnr family transcriptional regulator [Lachnospiraceae bacterium]
MECRLFNEINDEEQKKMLTCAGAADEEYKEGEYIFRQGDAPYNMYLIKKGSVMIAKEFASGKRNVLFTVYKGDVFGEMYLFSDEKEYWYDAIACEDVTVLKIPWKFFYGFCNKACRKHQMVIRNMLEVQSDKNFMMTRKLYLLSGKTLKERIAMWALDCAGEGDIFETDMKREELADYLGTTRPSLSRELMNMQDEGLIEIDRSKIKILNREDLEYFAE